MKIYINKQQVVCSNDFTIEQEMLSTPSVILNNVYPKAWEEDKDYVSRFYYPEDYSKCLIYGDNPVEFEILGDTTQNGTPTPENTIPVINKTGTITETIQNKNYTFNLGEIELCKIGTHQDRIYKSNGKWYLHKEISKIILTGDENWVYHSRNSNRTNTALFYALNEIDDMEHKTYDYDTLSNYFEAQNVYANDVQGYFVHYSSNKSYIYLSIDRSILNSVADLETWLEDNDTVIYYVLQTPTDTEITDSTLLTQLENVSYGLIFAGVVENTGEISLNPREPHFCNLQILDFKTFLSEGELDTFVIYQKTITEAINQIVSNIADYGFVVGNINILNPDEVIGAYSTQDKTAYDMFQYIADITQSRWTTRMIDENTVAIDFYDPTLMPEGTAIEYTKEWWIANDIHDMTFDYSSRDYRNKQVMTSDEVYGSIPQQEQIIANGYQTQYNTNEKIGEITSITANGIPCTFATNNEKELGTTADFYYTPGEKYFESNNPKTANTSIDITYIPLIVGRQVLANETEITRINNATGRKGIVSRYENRNDATTSSELQEIGRSYIKYKGLPEVTLTVTTSIDIWDVGQVVEFTAPLQELSTSYMVKKKSINYIVTADDIVYTFELTSSFNSETEINYFDNQRAKNKGNLSQDQFVARNVDINSTATVVFMISEPTSIQVTGDNILDCVLDSPFNN